MITTIELPIYDLDVVVLIEEDWTKTGKKFGMDLVPDELSAHGLTIMLNKPGQKHEIYVFLKTKYLDYNTICHELMHVVMFICFLKGIIADSENDEPLAYLQGYLAEKIFAFKEKYLEKNLDNPKT